jgi:hypothetical protein
MWRGPEGLGPRPLPSAARFTPAVEAALAARVRDALNELDGLVRG